MPMADDATAEAMQPTSRPEVDVMRVGRRSIAATLFAIVAACTVGACILGPKQDDPSNSDKCSTCSDGIGDAAAPSDTSAAGDGDHRDDDSTTPLPATDSSAPDGATFDAVGDSGVADAVGDAPGDGARDGDAGDSDAAVDAVDALDALDAGDGG